MNTEKRNNELTITEFNLRAAGIAPIYLNTLKRDNVFFSANNMRFFSSRILEATYNEKTCFFVTSEKASFSGAQRKYTVRQYDRETGRIVVIGSFCAYKTRNAAIAAKNEAELKWILEQL